MSYIYTKNNLKKQLFVSVFLGCFLSTTNVYAIKNAAKISGIFESQMVHYTNNNQLYEQTVSPYRKDIGILSTGTFFVDYQLIDADNIKYGAKIGIEHTTKNNNSTPLSLYIESPFGKIEGGSDKSSSAKMRITGYTGYVGSGGDWNMIVNGPIGIQTIAYVTDYNGFLDSKTRPSGRVNLSRKLSYFTPKITLGNENQVQLGVSYIPDASNNGHDPQTNKNHVFKIPSNAEEYKFSAKDGFTAGVSYEAKLSQDLSTKISLVGETAKVKLFKFDKSQKVVPISDAKLKNVSSYTIGTETKYDKFTFVASYMNYNRSLTSELDTAKNIYVYGFGGKYSFGKYTIGLNQFLSSYKKNDFSASSVGAECMIAQGFKSYVQYVYYKADGKYTKNGVINLDKAKGHVLFLGAKIGL